MRARPMTAVLAALATATVLALAGCAGDDRASSKPPAPDSVANPSATSGNSTPGSKGPVHYVALGDSFVAGPGIGATTGTCQRSTRNFPSIVAKRLNVASFTDASCSGANTADYTAAQRDNPPQLDAVTADTTLVTLGTMGGNDVGLVMTAARCVAGECGGAEAPALAEQIDALLPAIERSVEQVRERAPRARILLVGYGTYLPQQTCPALRGVTSAEVVYLQGVIDRLSDVIEQAARQTGVEFVDLRTMPGVRRHTPCAPPARQWIRGLSAEGDGALFHPSSAGMRAMAGQVVRAVEAG